jgi:hypothetical protein
VIKSIFGQAISQATETLQSGKDSTQSAVIKNLANSFIRKFGEMKELHINSKDKQIHISLYLKGESGDVIIDIGNYKISKDDDDYFIEINEVSANRYWIDALLKTFSHEKKIPIPPSFIVPMKILM